MYMIVHYKAVRIKWPFALMYRRVNILKQVKVAGCGPARRLLSLCG